MAFSLFDVGACNCSGGGQNRCGCTGIPNTLIFTHSVIGSVTITYGAMGWTGTLNYAYGGLGGCAAATIPILVTLGLICGLTMEWRYNPTNFCPVASGGTFTTFDFGSSSLCGNAISHSISCPPAFQVFYSQAGASAGSPCALLWGTGAYTGTVTP